MILAKEGNSLYLFGTIWSGDGMWFVSELTRMEKQHKDITIKLHTYGGSVFDGNIMCNAIEASKANITIEILGVAASMGAILTMSAKQVKMVENGFLMLHAPHSYTSGDAKTHESTAKLLRSMETQFLKKLSIRLNQPTNAVKKYIEGDNWVDAEEALKLGLISDIIPSQVETIMPIDNPEQMGELEVYNLYSPMLTKIPANIIKEPSNNIITDINFDIEMKQLLITAFALQLTEQSSDTAFVQALQEKFDELKGNLKNAETEKVNAEAKLQEYEKNRIDAMITEANLSEEQKETYRKIGQTSGIEALAEVLKDRIKPQNQAPDIMALVNKGNGANAVASGRENWDFDKWQKEDPKGLEKLSQEDPEKFDTLFNAKYK